MSTSARVADRVRHLLGLAWCRPAGILAQRPGSHVVLLDSARGRLVATLGDPASTVREATALAALGDIPGPLAVPPVLLHDPAAGLLVLGHCPGVPLTGRIAAGNTAAVHRAGASLARLQVLPAALPAALPPAGLGRHVADLVRPGPAAWAGHPLLGDRARRVLEALLAAEVCGVPARPVHRDLDPRRVLDDGPRTWLLGWEHAAVGDPAVDVGHLCGHLRARLPPAVAEPAVTAFRAGYAGGDRDGALQRAPLYEAFAVLRLACAAARDGRAGFEVDRLLGLAERRTAEATAGARA